MFQCVSSCNETLKYVSLNQTCVSTCDFMDSAFTKCMTCVYYKMNASQKVCTTKDDLPACKYITMVGILKFCNTTCTTQRFTVTSGENVCLDAGDVTCQYFTYVTADSLYKCAALCNIYEEKMVASALLFNCVSTCLYYDVVTTTQLRCAANCGTPSKYYLVDGKK